MADMAQNININELLCTEDNEYPDYTIPDINRVDGNELTVRIQLAEYRGLLLLQGEHKILHERYIDKAAECYRLRTKNEDLQEKVKLLDKRCGELMDKLDTLTAHIHGMVDDLK